MTNGTYWYPLLTDMTGMTKDQQQGYINQLNCQGYGGIRDWNFATLDEVMAMGFSMSEGSVHDPSLMGPPNANKFPGVDPTVYFEPTNYIGPTFPFTPIVLTGRTAD